MRVKEAVKSRKGSEKVIKEDSYEVLIQVQQEQGRNITTNRKKEILERCVEFYRNIYSNIGQKIMKRKAKDVLPTLKVKLTIH